MFFRRVLITIGLIIANPLIAIADFGEADFPIEMFNDGPKSYHDGWCRALKKKCRIRFQGPAMWIEGQGGIQIDQFISFRMDVDGKWAYSNEFYNYITYLSSDGVNQREALFLFANEKAQREFVMALNRWRKQEAKPIPNFRLPASQGPQETQGRDKGNNPYDNPPIDDWSIKTTPEKIDPIISPMDMD